MSRDNRVRVTRALHCNLNTRALVPAAAVYEDGLGFVTRMRSRSEQRDASSLGIATPATSTARFLFDHRGGRVGPAIELVEWQDPPTTGEAYAEPTAVGMHAVGMAVPSVRAAVAQLAAAGATATQRRSTRVDALMHDTDGVQIDLVSGHDIEQARFAYVRLNCADLARTTEWFEGLGLVPSAEPVVERWEGDGLGGGGADVPTRCLTFGDRSGFAILLTAWPGTDAEGRAHDHATHRGLYRMALAVEDVRDAVARARADGRFEPSDPEYIPLADTPLAGLWVSFLRDPDGVTVELVERPAA